MTVFVSRTVGDVVSEILMSRSAFSGSFLVLEGDEDVKFWELRAARNECQFVLAGSKVTVVGAVLKSVNLKQIGLLGIVDDDYDSLLGLSNHSVHLIRTETRDMETLLLSSPALDKVLTELGDTGKIRELEQREGKSIRDALVSRALIFGRLRLLSALNKWTIPFDALSPFKFADVASWSFDRAAILREITDRIHGITCAMLESQLANITAIPLWSVLHGKDTLSVLAIGLRSAIGNQQHPRERIMQMLRLAFDDRLFHDTLLYEAVKAWEAANSPYRVLPT